MTTEAMDFEVTRLGERGQVVIPQVFRKKINMKTGDKFIVMQRGEALIFKKMEAPSIDDFNIMIEKGHEHARRHNLTPADMEEAIKKARGKK
ncbi:MAG: AbrB/MazE/SpoVT family DNA-binding domain-containing protein [Nanoarchaeota archaeon]|nr:AbrB/MazE/SpoVT family DNA-binding domain-containing protein [Nanoarchaeota archaeon]